jgi:hypothetical protein
MLCGHICTWYLLFHDHIRGTEKKTIASVLLKRNVDRFLKYNHGFGRKQINASIHGNPFAAGSQNRVLTSSFNDKHEIFTIQQADEDVQYQGVVTENIGDDLRSSSSDEDSDTDTEDEDSVGGGVGGGTNEISAVVGSEFRNSYSDDSFLSPQSSFVSLGSTRLSLDLNTSGGLGAIQYGDGGHPVRRANAVVRNRG